MVEFTSNDVLLIHNNDLLCYALESVGNRRFQVYLDIYRQVYVNAENNKDTDRCEKIVADIVDTICNKSEPKGRFLEFDEKNQAWYDVGTGAIPYHRARTGLLGLTRKSPDHNRNDYHVDKPILEMSKTRRARTMKALHCGEKSLRTVVNLNDDRFKIKDEMFLLDEVDPLVEKEFTNSSPAKVSNKRKRVTFSETTKETVIKRERTVEKKSKAKTNDFDKNIICGGAGEGILNNENNGNILFLSLIEARRSIYTSLNDHAKFQEVCNVMKLMKEISPSSKFVQYDNKSIKQEFKELSWEDAMERTIHAFCNKSSKPCHIANKCQPSGVVTADTQPQNVLQEPLHVVSNDSVDVPDIIPSTESDNGKTTLKSVDNTGDDGLKMTSEYNNDFLDGFLEPAVVGAYYTQPQPEASQFACTDILGVPDNVPSTVSYNELDVLISEDSVGDDEGLKMTLDYKDEFLDGIFLEENEQCLPDNADYIHSILV